MQYKKLTSGHTIIEFHNNWLGEETVIVNGQIVSKKSSFWGTHHYFTVMEDGHHARYVLTTKVSSSMQVLLDFKRNGELIKEDVLVGYGTTKPRTPQNLAKIEGLKKLQEYDLNGALEQFKFALDVNPKDPEIHFHMACAFSVKERTKDGFLCLKNAVEYGLPDQEMILNHDMLAYLRMHEAFEDFLNSGFKDYDASKLSNPDFEF